MLFLTYAIIVCTSSSVLLQARAWRSISCGRYNSVSTPRAATQDRSRGNGRLLIAPLPRSSWVRRASVETFPTTAGPYSRRRGTSMGPIHGSASVYDKISSIRTVLGEGEALLSDGLQVIMDFDLTMTAPGSEQCHHMFETSSALSAELRGKLAPFFSGHMEVSSREEWWERFHSVLVGARITREQVASVARGADVALREGTAELLLLLEERGVPLLIVSAGISDIVEETLRGQDLLLDNVTVRGNTMHFGEDGKLEGFRESPPVHSRNKHQTAERESAYFESHSHRRCIIVVGDKPGDADVNHGISPDERCLKIGFFDHSQENPHPDLPPLPPPGEESPATNAAAASNKTPESPEQSRVSPPRPGTNPQTGTILARGLVDSGPVGTVGVLDLLALPAEASAATRAASIVSLPGSRERIGWPLEREGDGAGGGARLLGSGKDKVTEYAAVLERIGDDQEDSAERHINGGCSNHAAHPARALEAREEDEGVSRQSGTVRVALEEMLREYGDSFDVVARGGHSMGLVTDFVRHLIGDVDDLTTVVLPVSIRNR